MTLSRPAPISVSRGGPEVPWCAGIACSGLRFQGKTSLKVLRSSAVLSECGSSSIVQEAFFFGPGIRSGIAKNWLVALDPCNH